MGRVRILLLGVISCLLFAQPGFAAGNVRDAVVKVFVTSNGIDYYRPWQTRGSEAATGSGFIIGGNRIITNAHVASDSTFIQVRKESNPKKYTAHLEAIGYDCDLAILRVDDPEFFAGVEPLSFGELPQLQDTVIVLGFPLGGDKLSITEGVVSRIEVIPYVESVKKLLGVQIDAAINPGNSGGPVIQNGKVVGVAMQVANAAQNIGYMIPTNVINHFLDDLKDGEYQGFPTLGVDFSNTESDALRKFYKLDDKNRGVVINNIMPFSAAENQLKEGDVVEEIDGIAIGFDGTFEFRPNERLALSQIVNNKQIGDNLSATVVRDGKSQKITIKLTSFKSLVAYPHEFIKPPYYIYGGLIFTVLSVDLLKTWGDQWWEKAPLDFLYYLVGKGRLNDERKKEIVVLLEVLPDDINVGYHDSQNEVISRINGKTFNSFAEFVAILEKNKDKFAVFQTDNQMKIILETNQIIPATDAIIKRNNIPVRYSDPILKQ